MAKARKQTQEPDHLLDELANTEAGQVPDPDAAAVQSLLEASAEAGGVNWDERRAETAMGEHAGAQAYRDGIAAASAAASERVSSKTSAPGRSTADFNQSRPNILAYLPPALASEAMAGAVQTRLRNEERKHNLRVQEGRVADRPFNPNAATMTSFVVGVDFNSFSLREKHNQRGSSCDTYLAVTQRTPVAFGHLLPVHQDMINAEARRRGEPEFSPEFPTNEERQAGARADTLHYTRRVVMENPRKLEQTETTSSKGVKSTRDGVGDAITYVDPVQAQEWVGKEGSNAELIGTRALEAYHERKGPIEGTDERRPSPKLSAILSGPGASEVEVDAARRQASGRYLAHQAGISPQGRINHRMPHLIAQFREEAGLKTEQQWADAVTPGREVVGREPTVSLPVTKDGLGNADHRNIAAAETRTFVAGDAVTMQSPRKLSEAAKARMKTINAQRAAHLAAQPEAIWRRRG